MLNLKSLNDEQYEAVVALEGPVAVIAGAGTGKTRTIVFRTANLLEHRVKPGNILCITFTNKAAREMRERISAMMGEDLAKQMTISTIHALCARMLREDIDKLGRKRSFTIFDTSDQASMVRRALTDHGIDPQKNDPRTFLFRISAVKAVYPPLDPSDFEDQVFAKVFRSYNKLLEENNALDFDDLLAFGAQLLNNDEVREKYNNRFKYIMVDEFQDINDVQYQFVRRIAGERRNLYVVGDDDQSIYGWRGAVVENILEFEEDFEGAKVVKLERNYRSTATILEAAGAVIENNEKRRSKKLWTDGEKGDPVGLYGVPTDGDEADLVIELIMAERHTRNLKYGDFAILYRTNAQSRPFEEKLVQLGIQYTMIGGTRFFERKEIKDVTSYLRVAHNGEDDVSLLRVLNLPTRGIGASTKDKLQEMALEKRTPIFNILPDALNNSAIPIKARAGIEQFLKVIDTTRRFAENKQLREAAKYLVESLCIKEYLQKTNSDQNAAKRRFDNVQEWVNAIAEYETSQPNPTLEGFLENVALMTDEQDVETEFQEDSMVLMTMHSAKGLEFKVVYIVGAEEKYLPHERSIAEGTIDEERRLFYVGMTRARERLCITYADERRRFGETVRRVPSRFLGEIPVHLISDESPEEIAQKRAEAGKRIAEQSMERIRRLMEEN